MHKWFPYEEEGVEEKFRRPWKKWEWKRRSRSYENCPKKSEKNIFALRDILHANIFFLIQCENIHKHI